jgi:chromosome segregation ATPase
LQTNTERLTTQLEELQHDHQEALRTSATSLDTLKQELTTAIDRAEQAEQQLEQQHGQMSALTTQHATLSTTQQTTHTALDMANQNMVDLNADLEKSNAALIASQTKNIELEQIVSSMKKVALKEREESSVQFSVLSEECRTAVQGREGARQKTQVLQSEVDRLVLQVETALRTEQERERVLVAREKELKAAVAKLSKALDACEGEITCMHCLRIFIEPATLVGSGDTYCTACIDTGEIENVDVEEDRCRVKRLETLSGKFGFMKQALDQLKNKCVEE